MQEYVTVQYLISAEPLGAMFWPCKTYMQGSAQLSVATGLHIDPLVDGEADQVKGLFYSTHHNTHRIRFAVTFFFSLQ